jgi:hypothetical protein
MEGTPTNLDEKEIVNPVEHQKIKMSKYYVLKAKSPIAIFFEENIEAYKELVQNGLVKLDSHASQSSKLLRKLKERFQPKDKRNTKVTEVAALDPELLTNEHRAEMVSDFFKKNPKIMEQFEDFMTTYKKPPESPDLS